MPRKKEPELRPALTLEGLIRLTNDKVARQEAKQGEQEITDRQRALEGAVARGEAIARVLADCLDSVSPYIEVMVADADKPYKSIYLNLLVDGVPVRLNVVKALHPDMHPFRSREQDLDLVSENGAIVANIWQLTRRGHPGDRTFRPHIAMLDYEALLSAAKEALSRPKLSDTHACESQSATDVGADIEP